MSQLLIQHYLNQLADLRKVSGTRRASVVRTAIRAGAAQIGSHHEKQTFLKVIYENSCKVYNR